MLLLAIVIWCGNLEYRKLALSDEGRYAEIPRYMAQSNDWITPRLNGIKYFDFTLFRPFNWIGAGLDSIHTPKEGSSRVITQFFGHIVRGEHIKLVDGGTQKRAFSYVSDAIAALMKVIENPGGIANGKIYIIGNPDNSYSVKNMPAGVGKSFYPSLLTPHASPHQ